MKPTSQASDSNDDSCSTLSVFIALFIIAVVINILLVVIIIYFVVKARKTSYSPNNV